MQRRKQIGIDLESIIELDRLNMEPFLNGFGIPYDPERRRKGLFEEIQKGAIFITVKRDGRLAGYIEYIVEDGGDAYVPSIQVHPEYKGRFILRGLLSNAYHELKDHFPTMVRSSVHKNNKMSLKLHNRLGFARDDVKNERTIVFSISGEKLVDHLAMYACRK